MFVLLLCVCTQGAVLGPGQLSGVGVLLLQREVPEAANLAAAQAAHDAGIPVMLVSWLGALGGGRGGEWLTIEPVRHQSCMFTLSLCCAVLKGNVRRSADPVPCCAVLWCGSPVLAEASALVLFAKVLRCAVPCCDVSYAVLCCAVHRMQVAVTGLCPLPCCA